MRQKKVESTVLNKKTYKVKEMLRKDGGGEE